MGSILPVARAGPGRCSVVSRCLAVFALIAGLLAPASAWAAPEAHILRVDPRAAQASGEPILTTVIDLVQPKRVSQVTRRCAKLTGNAQLDCMSTNLERPYSLYTPFPFPANNAIFTVRVDGADQPAKFVSQESWGASLGQPGVGTAWLILLDADQRMGRSLDDARRLARKFVSSMGANDIVDVMVLNDRQVVRMSKWLSAAHKARATSLINSVTGTYPAHGNNRPLATIVKNAATDGFDSLGNVGKGVTVPMHQAMVLLSSGFGGTDPTTTGPGALWIQQYISNGRFPGNNPVLPKAPVPVISVYFPYKGPKALKQNSLDFMQNLANPEIGGFFTVMRPGQGSHAARIVSRVHARFNQMHIVRWRVSCIAPTITQTFKLVFNSVKPPILGDNSFRGVPVGLDPATWPLDVELQYTEDQAKHNPVRPGGTFEVYGNFCWGGDTSRAEVYFLPSGQELPAALGSTDVDKAKRAQQQLIAMGMKGTAVRTSDVDVEFKAPDNDRILQGSGSKAVVRVVLYDNRAHRMSGATAKNILQLAAVGEVPAEPRHAPAPAPRSAQPITVTVVHASPAPAAPGWRTGIGASALVLGAVAPRPAPGLRLEFHVESTARRVWSPAFSVSAAGAYVGVSTAPSPVSFTWLAGRAAACPVSWLALPALGVRPCVALEAGVLSARSSEGQVRANGQQTRPWISADGFLALGWRISPFFELHARGGALLPWLHDRFVLEDAQGRAITTVHKAPVVGAFGELGLGFRL